MLNKPQFDAYILHTRKTVTLRPLILAERIKRLNASFQDDGAILWQTRFEITL